MSCQTNKTNIKLYTLLRVISLTIFSSICFVNGHEKHDWMHYILVWSISPTPPNSFINNLGKGQDTFIKRKCAFQNCYVTTDEMYLNNTHDFDAILFLGSELSQLPIVPGVRYDDQKYVFVSVGSAVTEPVSKVFNSFFNWTWTYKLDSDIRSNDVVVRNKKNEIIGPAWDMNWIKQNKMKPISQITKKKLETKRIAAIWFASNCNTSSKREDYIRELQRELLFEYKLDLRKCGYCGEYTCTTEKNDYCLSKVESDYYFYLAFENAICEDFVTERAVNALKHYTVPIVYGGANYSRFFPPGSYIDASKLNPEMLAKTMHSIINNKEKYYKFFRWRKYYDFNHIYESPETDDYCAFCALLNDYVETNERKAYTNFIRWWNDRSEWPIEWPEVRSRQLLVTTYGRVHKTLNKRVKLLVQNPISLLPPTLSNKDGGEEGFISAVGSFFRRYFMAK